MNCQSCNSQNLDDAEFCSTCGVKLAAPTRDGDWLAGMVADADDGPTAEQPPTAALDATAPLAEPATPPPAPGAPAPAPPPAAAPSQTSVHRAEPIGVIPTRRSSMIPVAIFCVLVAAVAVVAAIVISRPNDDPTDRAAPGTAVTVVTSAPTDTDPVSTDQPVPTVASTTVAADTTAPTTAATTTIATTTTTTTVPAPDDPAAVPPVPSEPGPVDAPGSPQVLANVLPSGLTYDEVRTSFELAQEYGDALALEDWDTAREIAPGAANNDDADFEFGYGATNRISLMLVDATPLSNGYRIVSVSVAVENGGAQTSLYCLTWDVDPDARTVQQVEGARIARWATNAQPEAIRNDAEAMATVNTCTGP